jgi:hypothetical protein
MDYPAPFVNWNATSQVVCSEAGPCILYLLYYCCLTCCFGAFRWSIEVPYLLLLLSSLSSYCHHRISHFSASAGKHSPILGYIINSNRLSGLIYNLKSFLQLNMFQELQIFAFVCTYWDAG